MFSIYGQLSISVCFDNILASTNCIAATLSCSISDSLKVDLREFMEDVYKELEEIRKSLHTISSALNEIDETFFGDGDKSEFIENLKEIAKEIK